MRDAQQLAPQLHPDLKGFGCPAQASIAAIKNYKRRLERNVAKDVDADACRALDAAEAGRARAVDGSKVDVAARDGDGGGADSEGEVGQGGGAREDIASLGSRVLCARDLLVVGRDDRRRQEEEGGAGVSDARDGRLGDCSRADAVAGRSEVPESLGLVHGGVSDASGEETGVDGAEVVGAG